MLGDGFPKLRFFAIATSAFVSGCLVVSLFFGSNWTTFDQKLGIVGLSIITLLLISVVAFAHLLRLQVGHLNKKIDDIIKPQEFYVVTSVDRAPKATTSLEDSAYNYCSRCVEKASKQILVISPHFPATLRVLPGTQSHDKYLDDGVTKALKEHLRSGQGQLEYSRILQIDENDYDEARDGSISAYAIRDAGLRLHIETIFGLAEQSDKLIINVYARPYTPSLPSILIIDSEHVFFSLPTNLSRAFGPDGTGISYDFVLGITETENPGKVVRDFKGIFTQFSRDAKRIWKYKD